MENSENCIPWVTGKIIQCKKTFIKCKFCKKYIYEKEWFLLNIYK